MTGAASDHQQRFASDEQALRDPKAVIGLWERPPSDIAARLRHRVRGDFWTILADLRLTLVVTREYEHLVVALSVADGRPVVSYLPLPHPNGLALTPDGHALMVASTRSPNAIFEVRAADPGAGATPVLLPTTTRFLPGQTYLHDLAFIGGELHANAVGHNTVIRISADGVHDAWWPRSVEHDGMPDRTANHLQLNSIAAGPTVWDSFFTASVASPGARFRPGHRRFHADQRGVVFSGRTREPIVEGLTRPHSIRFHGDELWLANSGYAEVGRIDGPSFEVVQRLPGWTRGLAITRDVAFVGTSRILPRFRSYAPGVTTETCGVHILDLQTGAVRASLTWPEGNQIFAIECLPSGVAVGLPYNAGAQGQEKRARHLFFSAIPTMRML